MASAASEEKAFFKIAGDGKAGPSAPRCGTLLGLPTPRCVVLTSRGMPLQLMPEAYFKQLGGGEQLVQLPVGDCMLRKDNVAGCPEAEQGGRGFWPHLKGHLTYCSFRNPLQNPSIYGGDSLCSVETHGGRRKVGPKELVSIQQVIRADIVAAPGEEVPLDVTSKRVGRAVSRAGDWLKELLEAKAEDPELKSFPWHLLASIQGGCDAKQRVKACEASKGLAGVAGFLLGGLGYDETLDVRGPLLQAMAEALPSELPRFLPLNEGSPVEVLQAALLGVDVFEIQYPVKLAMQGVALTFAWEMPAEESRAEASAVDAALAGLLPPSLEASAATAKALRSVRQLYVRADECREDFGAIDGHSPVPQYSRAYLHHLFEVRELLGTQLLTRHNLDRYEKLFEAIRMHIEKGTLRAYAAWFMKTQACEAPAVVPAGQPPAKKRKML
eukprot:TRINITY_DN30077_c0_g1_i1.p1 TRINITY_DN30077_c0_g1~~TRINITY_DN30077_c0_g1_i1.p1  ORF type:complete len:441 (+),score=117.30 TRINITY_DN30077_c0_g1_i1:47-1369(+)